MSQILQLYIPNTIPYVVCSKTYFRHKVYNILIWWSRGSQLYNMLMQFNWLVYQRSGWYRHILDTRYGHIYILQCFRRHGNLLVLNEATFFGNSPWWWYSNSNEALRNGFCSANGFWSANGSICMLFCFIT